MSASETWWYNVGRWADHELATTLTLLIGVTLILSTGAVVARFWPRLSAAQRHLVWSTACWSVLLLPVLRRVVPEYDLPILRVVVRALPTSVETPVRAPRPSVPPIGPGNGGRRLSNARIAEDRDRMPWAVLAFAVWGAGALFVLVPLFRSHRRLRRLDASASPFEDHRASRLLAEVGASIGRRRHITLKVHRSVMPMVYGVFRPVIVLPSHAASWPDERLRHVLLHEAAHVVRHDVLTQTVASFAAAIYWFHPLAWVAARQLRREREQACDDVVLEVGGRAQDYAADLLDLTTTLTSLPTASLAAIPFARSSHMHERLHAVLDTSRRRTAVSLRAALGTWGCAIGIVALAVGLSAPAVGAQQISDLKPGSPILARLKYNPVSSPEACQGSDSPAGAGWGHDYPMSVQGLMKGFRERLKSPSDSFAVVSVADPELSNYPMAMITEPGCWAPTDGEAQALRRYLEKGGFLLADDFTFFDCTPEHCQLAIERFERWMRKVLPDGRLVQVPASDPLFNQPFHVDPANVPSFSAEPAKIMGIYEKNDPTKRLLVVAAYWNALGQYWRYTPGSIGPDSTADSPAGRLGLNLVAYAVTH